MLSCAKMLSARPLNDYRVAVLGVLFATILPATAALAGETCETTTNGVTWTYCINENGTAEIFNGWYKAAVSPAPTGEIEIPNMLDGKQVTIIGESAFYGCDGLTGIFIPEGITNIAISAFEDCHRLIKFDVSKDNPRYRSHEGFLMTTDERSLLLAPSGLESVIIPDCVTNIEEKAFEYCRNLTSATLPQCACSSQLSQIFRSCFQRITNVVISASVTNIGAYAFRDCGSMENVTIPDGVVSIGDYAFHNCQRLASVRIPDSVTNIGNNTFEWCYNLACVAIPQYVCSIGLRDVFPSSYETITNVVINDSAMNIGDEAFALCRSIANIIIPDNVSSIGRSAFQDCRSLTSVTIGDNVTNVGEYAFQDCVALTNVVIGSNLTRIDYGTSRNCTNLNAITIPDNITSLMASAFQHCSGLTVIAIPDSVTNIDYKVFDYCSGLMDVTIPQCVCSNKLSAVFPSAYGAITNVSISVGVTAIADDAFRDCDGLAQMTIPGNVKVIGENAFRNCDGLRCVTIMDGVERIGSLAFMDCKNLSSVSIPDSVIKIGDRAFNSCHSSLFVNATIGGVTVKLVDGWVVEQLNVTSFGRDVGFAGIRGIGDRMFSPVDWTGVTISGCKAIGDYAFYQNIGLKRVTFDCNIRSIGECAFAGPRNLKSVIFQGDAPSVGPWSFRSTPEDCVVYIPQGNATYDVMDGRWQGMNVRYYTANDNLDVGDKGKAEAIGNGYVVTANDGETLAELDFAFPIGMENAYSVNIAPDGRSATVTLNPPMIGVASESEASHDPSDPAGVLVEVAESEISARPAAQDGESIGALPVRTYAGLYYQAAWGDDLGSMKSGEKIQATGDALYLGVIKQTGDKGFYKLSVSER